MGNSIVYDHISPKEWWELQEEIIAEPCKHCCCHNALLINLLKSWKVWGIQTGSIEIEVRMWCSHQSPSFRQYTCLSGLHNSEIEFYGLCSQEDHSFCLIFHCNYFDYPSLPHSPSLSFPNEIQSWVYLGWWGSTQRGSSTIRPYQLAVKLVKIKYILVSVIVSHCCPQCPPTKQLY